MRKLTLILLLFPLPLLATNYYVKNGGSDSNTGLGDAQAWASLTKVNSTTFHAGDNIYFKCGSRFRGYLIIQNSGSSGNPITLDEYGTGAKPQIWGSKDYSATNQWTNYSGNIWVTTDAVTTATDVANLIFNNEASCGIKKTALNLCTAQGNWYINTGDSKVYLYSTSNPGSFYTHIEVGGAYIGSTQEVISIQSADYITIRNLDVRYSPNNGIIFYGTNHSIVEYCNVSWIGGMYVPSDFPTRMGNGIGIWEAATDVIIRYNRVDQCYDAGISPQGGSTYTQSNIQVYYNVISNCYYSLEWFTRSPNTFTNTNYYNNTCVYSGYQWSENQRPSTGNEEHIRNTESEAVTSCNIKNNIFFVSIQRAAEFSIPSGCSLDYNLYVVTKMGNTGGSDYTTLAQWQSATGFDAHSITGTTLNVFVSTTDYHLQDGSVAIDKGVNVGLTQDFEGKPINGAPDMGALEYNGAPTPEAGETRFMKSSLGQFMKIGTRFTKNR